MRNEYSNPDLEVNSSRRMERSCAVTYLFHFDVTFSYFLICNRGVPALLRNSYDDGTKILRSFKYSSIIVSNIFDSYRNFATSSQNARPRYATPCAIPIHKRLFWYHKESSMAPLECSAKFPLQVKEPRLC